MAEALTMPQLFHRSFLELVELAVLAGRFSERLEPWKVGPMMDGSERGEVVKIPTLVL